jgi:hypothetical protein
MRQAMSGVQNSNIAHSERDDSFAIREHIKTSLSKAITRLCPLSGNVMSATSQTRDLFPYSVEGQGDTYSFVLDRAQAAVARSV